MIQQVRHEAEICRNNYNACILRLEWAYDRIRELQDAVNQLEGEVALAEIKVDEKETEIFELKKLVHPFCDGCRKYNESQLD